MIQTAAPTVASSLALGLGAQAQPAGDAAASGDFAALLDSTLATGQDAAADPAAALQAAIALQMRQGPGNLAGKKLPVGDDIAAALADAAAQPAEATAKDGETTDAATVMLPAIPSEIILPGLILPVSVQAPVTPSSANDPNQGTAAQAIRTPAASQPAIAAAIALQAAQAQAVQTPAPQAQAAQSQAAAALPTATTLPLPATPPSPAAILAAAQAADPSGAPKAGEGVRTGTKPADAKTARVHQRATLAALTGAQPTTAQVAAQAAATAKSGDPQQPATDAAPATPSLAQAKASAPEAKGSPSQQGESGKPDARAVIAETSVAAPSPAALAAQPAFALQDGQSLSQAVGSAGGTQAAAGAPSGHDFATLVDRLVEAREAAAPGPVHAAISHAEFGQVSLRFEQDGNGLSVAMSSADPGFADAVQVSAASAQSQTGNDNGSNAQRQDTSGQLQQQGAGAAAGQQQSSASGRGERDERDAPARADNRSGRADGQPSQADDTADTRGGIYA